MAHTRTWSQLWTRCCLSVLLLLTLSRWTQALGISYCSPDNDAGSNFLTSPYMSNGKCQDNCESSYVFAVILGQNCWCSNYIPATQDDNSLCSDACPGFPYEQCGNSAQGLYGYFNLGGTPSGTAGGSSSSAARTTTSASSSAEPSSSPLSPSIVTETVSATPSRAPSTSSNTPPPSTTASSTSTAAPTPVPAGTTADATQVYTSIISVTGGVSTIIVTSTPSSTPAGTTDSALGGTSEPSKSGRSSGLSGGTVAGIVVGVAIAIGLIIGAIIFLWLRRRHQKNLAAISESGSFTSPSHASKNNGGIPSRQVSQMSSAGLLTKPSRANTGGLSNGDDSRSNGQGTFSSDRNSTHMTVDQRLNPWAIYTNEDSRASNVSLHDNQDYSRQLRVANPDP